MTIQAKLFNFFIESDSQAVITAIMGANKAPSIISNIVADILVLASTVTNIKFVFL